MGEIINLNKRRKQQARQDSQARAAANRASHGMSKAERSAAAKQSVATARDLDGKRLD
jgi:hypothetical protein